MSRLHRHPVAIGVGIATVAVLLLPLSYVAGWMGDLAQVKPELVALAQSRQHQAWLRAHQPQQPPQGSPQVQAQWTASSVTLSWSQVPRASQYTIYRAANAQTFSKAKTVATVAQTGTPVQYTDATVAPGTAYTYWVASDNAMGQGAPSAPRTIRTYLTWTTLSSEAESQGRLGTVTTWSKTAWGILGQSATSHTFALWNIAGHLVTPDTAATASSTWFTQKGVRWTLGTTRLFPSSQNPPTTFSNAITLQTIPTGEATPENLAVWQSQQKWRDAIVAKGQPLPPDALLLNQYGEAIGLTNAQSDLVRDP